MSLAAVAVEGIGITGLIGIFGPLAAGVVAIVLLGPQRSKLVGESLGDAIEDLRSELTAMREERNAFRDERDQVRVDLCVVKEELRLVRAELRAALARNADSGTPGT